MLSLIPLWVWLAGVPVAFWKGGVWLGRQYGDDPDLPVMIFALVCACIAWPIGAPVFLAVQKGRALAVRDRAEAKRIAELDLAAEREGLKGKQVVSRLQRPVYLPPRDYR